MHLSKFAVLLATISAIFAATVPICRVGEQACDDTSFGIRTCVAQPEGGLRWLHTEFCFYEGVCRVASGTAYCEKNSSAPTAPTATVAACRLGANKCDDTDSSVMVCGAHGWKVAETCEQAGACHIGSAGNAYCDKKIQCTPGESQCDASNYVSRFCNDKGFWQTDRKCSKPGCCAIQNGKAICKLECGPGLEPPARHSTLKVARDGPNPGDPCTYVGDGYCDNAHNCVLRCNGDMTLHQEKCCKDKGGCAYNSASLEPYCK